MKMKYLIIPVLCVLSSGCMTYRSVIKSTEFGTFELPKDVSWETLKFSRTTTDPHTCLPVATEVEIKGLKASMNPAIIDAETARILALIDAGFKAAKAAGAASVP